MNAFKNKLCRCALAGCCALLLAGGVSCSKKQLKRTAKDKSRLCIYSPDLDVPSDSEDKSGDCTVIVSPDGKVMVIDCGHPAAFRYVSKLLTDLKITKIDFLVISHPHIDHVGGIPALCALYPVGECYYSGLEYPSQYYEGFTRAMESHKIPVHIVKDGDSFMFGEKVKCDILWPEGNFEYPDGYPENSTQFVNDTSIALKMTYGGSTALFCGDLYRSAERGLIAKHKDELRSDVAKANHHGNDTSNSLSWIKAVNPKIVYAMNDKIGSMAVYKQYTKNGVTKFYHSAENGTIKITMDDKKNYEVQTQFESWLTAN